jgi:hypothetical protein
MPSPTPQMRKTAGGGIAQQGGSGGSSSALAYSTYTMDPNGLPGDRNPPSRAPSYSLRGSSPMRSSNSGQYGSSGQLPPADNYGSSYQSSAVGGRGNMSAQDYLSSSQGGTARPSSGGSSRYGTPTRQQMPVWR